MLYLCMLYIFIFFFLYLMVNKVDYYNFADIMQYAGECMYENILYSLCEFIVTVNKSFNQSLD